MIPKEIYLIEWAPSARDWRNSDWDVSLTAPPPDAEVLNVYRIELDWRLLKNEEKGD